MKSESAAKENEGGAEQPSTLTTPTGPDSKGKAVDDKKAKQPQKPKAKARYILFVGEWAVEEPDGIVPRVYSTYCSDCASTPLSGNLPRQSTAPEIASWFENQVQARPSVRLLTSKPAPGAPSSSGGKGESRGIAFIECVSHKFLLSCGRLHRARASLKSDGSQAGE